MDELVLITDDPVVLIENAALEDGADLGDLLDLHTVGKLRTVQLGVLQLVRTGGDVLAARVERYMTGAVSQCGAGHVHGGVSHTDDGHAVAQLVPFGIGQIVETKEHIAEALAFNAEASGFFRAGTNEDTGVSVTKQLVNHQDGSYGGVGADRDTHLFHACLIPVENALGQAELGNAILQKSADLALPFKHRDGVSLLCQRYGHGHASRAASDDGDLLVLFLRPGDFHAIKEHLRDVVLNTGEMDRHILPAADTVTGALHLVVADNGTDRGHGVIAKQHVTGFHQAVFLEELNDDRNRCMDGTALLAHGLFTVETAVGFVDDMQSHGRILLLYLIDYG